MTLMVKVELRAEHYKKIQKDCINWAINVRHAALERQLLHDRHPGRYEKLQPRGGWRLQRVRGTVTESWPNAYHDVSEKDSRYQRNLADTIFRRDWTCTCCYKITSILSYIYVHLWYCTQANLSFFSRHHRLHQQPHLPVEQLDCRPM